MLVSRQEVESVAHTRRNLAKWGVEWPPPKGWKKALIKGADPNAPSRKREKLADADTERMSMKRLYQEKSGDYSY
jgi:hypothetical protein